MNYKRMWSGVAVTSALALAGITAAYAADTTVRIHPMDNLVQAISEKFNLNKDDVQQVFDDQKAVMETERKQADADRLSQAVTDGELTQAQSDAITAKQAELEAERASITPPDPAELEALTDEEREAKHEAMKAEMDAKREELTQWAADNEIPKEYVQFAGGHGGPGGHGEERGGHGMFHAKHGQ